MVTWNFLHIRRFCERCIAFWWLYSSWTMLDLSGAWFICFDLGIWDGWFWLGATCWEDCRHRNAAVSLCSTLQLRIKLTRQVLQVVNFNQNFLWSYGSITIQCSTCWPDTLYNTKRSCRPKRSTSHILQCFGLLLTHFSVFQFCDLHSAIDHSTLLKVLELVASIRRRLNWSPRWKDFFT